MNLDLDCGRAEKVGLREAERVKALVTLPALKFEPQDPHGRKRELTSAGRPLTSTHTLLHA